MKFDIIYSVECRVKPELGFLGWLAVLLRFRSRFDSQSWKFKGEGSANALPREGESLWLPGLTQQLGLVDGFIKVTRVTHHHGFDRESAADYVRFLNFRPQVRIDDVIRCPEYLFHDGHSPAGLDTCARVVTNKLQPALEKMGFKLC